jgi:hypothetical protein
VSIIQDLSDRYKAATALQPVANPADSGTAPVVSADLLCFEADYQFGRSLAMQPEADIRSLDAIPAASEGGRHARIDGWNDEREKVVSRVKIAIREANEQASEAWSYRDNGGCH